MHGVYVKHGFAYIEYNIQIWENTATKNTRVNDGWFEKII